MRKVNNFIKQVKSRWNMAPTWVKVLDISCWVVLFSSLGYIYFT